MTSPAGAPLGTKVSEFAFSLKNEVRQRGLHRLGLPCHLTGSGMAFPWATISTLDLADGHLAEDMKMGLNLALAGHPPLFCERAVVLSAFPETTTGLATQRGRWIKGHITLISTALRAIPTALYQGRPAAALAAHPGISARIYAPLRFVHRQSRGGCWRRSARRRPPP